MVDHGTTIASLHQARKDLIRGRDHWFGVKVASGPAQDCVGVDQYTA
jgi:hypothetical protein